MIDTQAEDGLLRRVKWRIIPLLVLLYLVAYIDRQNVSYAKLQMLDTLHLSEVAYGLGASLFFIGYLLFEVPSNLALHKVGARRWLARIMLTWGLVTLLLAFTSSAAMFYILRFLLGAAEAGFYPGVIYYLTLWFPERHRVRVVGLFTLGSSLGNMVGALIGGVFLDLDGLGGLQGWQWVFIATGIPAIALTFVTLRWLPESPARSSFLSDEEKARLEAALRREAPVRQTVGNPLSVLWSPVILGLAFFYMMISVSIYGVGYWLPTVVKGFGVSSTVNGMLNMMPWFVTSLVLLWVPGRLRSPAQVVRAVLLAAPIGIGCFLIATYAGSNVLRLAALTIGAPCLYIMIPCFWSVPPKILTGVHAAAGIAAINSLGNIGGFLGQNVMPWVGRVSGSLLMPMLVPAACLVVLGFGALLAVRLIRLNGQFDAVPTTR